MASAFTHAFVAVVAGKITFPRPHSWKFWVSTVALSVLPDLDVVGFAFGIRYGDVLGHRGFSHSIVFALLAGGAALAFFPERSWKLWAYFSFVTASHGILDAMTDGGLGVAFFSPFLLRRYFLPWRPIPVSPIGVGEFFSDWGMTVLLGEVRFVWLPTLLILVVLTVLRRRRKSREEVPTGDVPRK